MLEKLLKNPEVLARHKSAPFAEERERYLAHKSDQKYAESTLIRLASELLLVSDHFRSYETSTEKICVSEIQEAAEKWAASQCDSGRAQTGKWSGMFFARLATDWFRFLGRLQEPVPKPCWYASLLEDYVSFMTHEQNLSRKTIHNRCWHAEQFLQWYKPRRRGLGISSIQITDIDDFLKTCSNRGWSRSSLACSAGALRMFFRHASMRQWCDSAISQSIQGPRLFMQLDLPSGPSWKDIERLIDCMGTESPSDIRDRAIVLLFAMYGLRSSEVANLRLNDIGWQDCRITFTRTKQRRSEVYPLVPVVGNALIHYLQAVRQQSTHREVFLTLKAPFKPLEIQSFYNIVSRRIVSAEISTTHRGPNSLSHACATHLLAEGLSLKEIGDHLGHRKLSTTQVYAKVDLLNLRKVAQFNFGGVL